MSDGQASGPPFLGHVQPFGRHWFDIAAVALLGLGCLSGTLVLLVQGSVRGTGPSPAEPRLQQRVRELERRLIEQVPASVEQKYRDY